MTRRLILALLLAALLPSFSAQADGGFNFPPIQVDPIVMKNVPGGASSAVTLFFAAGSNLLSVSGSLPYSRRVFGDPLTASVQADGTASFSAASVARAGFQIPNYLIIIVHAANQDITKLCNLDGGIAPQADAVVGAFPQVSDSCKYTQVYALHILLNDNRTGIAALRMHGMNRINLTAGQPIVLDLSTL